MEEPRFSLGEMVLHSSKGYRGVVCGWDLACCESEEWQAAAGIRRAPFASPPLLLAAALPKNTFAAKQAPKVAKALGLVIFVRGLFCALPAVVAALRIPRLGLRLAISIRTGAFAGGGTAGHNGSRRQWIIAAAVPAALRGL